MLHGHEHHDEAIKDEGEDGDLLGGGADQAQADRWSWPCSP
jgi:hypothetical protein